MTTKEAIEMIRIAIAEVEWCYQMDYAVAFEMAINALEKQNLKKPTFVDTRFRHHGRDIGSGCSIDKCYKCPCCGSHIFHVFDSDRYCKCCGQALDWEVK